jgi:CPA2 family monovalent cation:H+ antiporter-2
MTELLIVLAAGLLANVVSRQWDFPTPVGYLAAGAVLATILPGVLVGEQYELEHLAEAGVLLLLFSVGLELDLDQFRDLARYFFVSGSLQMVLVFLPALAVLAGYLDWSWESSILVSLALSFSSTVLVFKSLAERGAAQTPYGRRAIAILLFQDVALVPLLLLIPLLTVGNHSAPLPDYTLLGVRSLAFVVGVIVLRWALAHSIIPALAAYRSPEVVVLLAVVLLGMVLLAAHRLALPIPVGALAAGIALGGNRWARQIDALVLPFRETCSAVFFVSLGLLFDARFAWQNGLSLVVLFVLLVVVKTAAAALVLAISGLPARQTLPVACGLAHVGEFAFILLVEAMRAGLITEDDYRGFLTVSLASLLLAPILLRMSVRTEEPSGGDLHVQRRWPQPGDESLKPVIVIGLGPVGRRVANLLETTGHDVRLIDQNPLNLHDFAQSGFATFAGDAVDGQVLRSAGAAAARLVVFCIPHDELALRAVVILRSINRTCRVVVRCRYQSNERRLIKAGADLAVSDERHTANTLVEQLNEMLESSSR